MSSGTEPPTRQGASLERSLQWTLGVLVALVLVGITGAGAWIGREAAIQFVVTRLAHDAEAIIAGIDIAAGDITRPLPPVYSQPLSGHYFVVLPAAGEALRSRSLWDTMLDVGALAPGHTAKALQEGPRAQRLLVWRAGYERQGRAFTIAIAEDVAPLLTALRRFLWTGIVLAVITSALLLWIQRRLLRRGFHQLDEVRADIRRLARGEARRMHEDVPAEVRPLVDEFDHLITVWQGHLQRSRDAAGNLAHALKSPLQLIVQRGRETGDVEVTDQSIRMQQLIERELHRARLAGRATAARRFAPAADIADLVATVRALRRDRTLEITTDIDAPAHLPFDQEDMLELIGNLLDNAAKWARSRITLGIAAVNGVLRIRVEDDGPGVDPEEAEHLLSRGTRLDESRPGHGLGLAIVSDIVKLYDGRIAMAPSGPLGGLTVTIELPLHLGL